MSGVVTDLRQPTIARPVFKVSIETRDLRIERARPDTRRFLALVVQLVLLLAVIRVYRVEQFLDGYLGFFSMCCIAFGGFAIHYWLPFQLKEKFWVAISMAATILFLPWMVAVGVLASGAVLYLVLASPLSYWTRVAIVISAAALATVSCAYTVWLSRAISVPVLGKFWHVLGGIFMFRLIVYLYDLREMRGRPPLTEFLAYFFILPNYLFLFFPVIDYKTMRISYYRRDIHDVAQQGISWICRGTVQLLLYLVVSHLQDLVVLHGVHSLASLVSLMFLTFLLYLHVSGYFHISIGILLLFGYDLPETNHKYLLSSSLTDFWRRINIYWKDFMVKIVYFPVYFRLRKKGELRAKMVGTAMVFVVTWALHSYQTFWLRGHLGISWPDTLFWATLGSLVMVNVWWESRHQRRRLVAKGLGASLRNGLSVVATMALIVTLWSLWNAPSLTAWADLVTWWRPGV